jgi:hypothetical protein
LICAFGFIAAHYANDFLIGQNGHFPCETGFDKSEMRSIFRPVWSYDLLQLGSRITAYCWGLTSLLVLYKTSKVPSDLYED